MREGVFDLGAIDGSYTYYDNEGSIIVPVEENRLDLKDGKSISLGQTENIGA